MVFAMAAAIGRWWRWRSMRWRSVSYFSAPGSSRERSGRQNVAVVVKVGGEPVVRWSWRRTGETVREFSSVPSRGLPGGKGRGSNLSKWSAKSIVGKKDAGTTKTGVVKKASVKEGLPQGGFENSALVNDVDHYSFEEFIAMQEAFDWEQGASRLQPPISKQQDDEPPSIDDYLPEEIDDTITDAIQPDEFRTGTLVGAGAEEEELPVVIGGLYQHDDSGLDYLPGFFQDFLPDPYDLPARGSMGYVQPGGGAIRAEQAREKERERKRKIEMDMDMDIDIKLELKKEIEDKDTGVTYVDLVGWKRGEQDRKVGVGGALMGVRIYKPPPPPPPSMPQGYQPAPVPARPVALGDGTRALVGAAWPEPQESLPVIIFFPSGLPVTMPPPPSRSSSQYEPIAWHTTPLITPADHKTALLLSQSSNQPVFMPFYLPGSAHVKEQINPSLLMDEEEGSEPEKAVKERYMANKNGNVKKKMKQKIEKSKEAETRNVMKETSINGKKLIHPYPPHPLALHDAVELFTYILSHLGDLLPKGWRLPAPKPSTPKVQLGPSSLSRAAGPKPLPEWTFKIDLCLGGSLVGGGVAATLGLTEFKHLPFDPASKIPIGGTIAEKKAIQLARVMRHLKDVDVTIEVHLASMALISPLLSWTFPPLGAFDFTDGLRGDGRGGWMLPPPPPLLENELDIEVEERYLIPTPSLPTLLRLRHHHFPKGPEDYIDHHASPLNFFYTPGVDVGEEILRKLWVGLNLRGRHHIPKFNRDHTIDVITMEGTRRRQIGRRWPPRWVSDHFKQPVAMEKGGIPRRGRCLIIVKDVKAPPSHGQPTTVDRPVGALPISMNPRTAHIPTRTQFDGMIELPRGFDLYINEGEEYSLDLTTISSYTHPTPRDLAELYNPEERLLPRILATTRGMVMNDWLAKRGKEFAEGMERAWRKGVLGSDKELRAKEKRGLFSPYQSKKLEKDKDKLREGGLVAIEGLDDGVDVPEGLREQEAAKEVATIRALGRWVGHVAKMGWEDR